jgi:hypothetical protein
MGRGKREPYHDQFTIFKKYGHYYVKFRTDPAHPKSTGVPLEKDEDCSWTRWKMTKAHKNNREPFGAAYLPTNRGR